MSNIFKVRAIHLELYRDTVARLDRIVAGDDALMRGTIAEADETLVSSAFLRHNPLSIVERWRRRLAQASGMRAEPGAVDIIAEPVLVTRCMPGFQFVLIETVERSPSFVPLGNDDAGLYALLLDDEWFETLFVSAFNDRAERYPVGDYMFILARGELVLLERAAEKIGPIQSPAAEPRERLLALVRACLADPELSIAISEN